MGHHTYTCNEPASQGDASQPMSVKLDIAVPDGTDDDAVGAIATVALRDTWSRLGMVIVGSKIPPESRIVNNNTAWSCVSRSIMRQPTAQGVIDSAVTLAAIGHDLRLPCPTAVSARDGGIVFEWIGSDVSLIISASNVQIVSHDRAVNIDSRPIVEWWRETLNRAV